MNRNSTLPQTVLCFFLFLSLSALAQQTDSTRYDLGFLRLNKAFTQHVTIRGEDLEKMPFANLDEAIRAWLFGAYTQPLTLAYVVDGNPVTDVNIYSIHDIAEVTWISNAVATAPYGNSQKELVLVTTKRGQRTKGIEAAAQGGYAGGAETGEHSTNGVYQQYFLGGSTQWDHFDAGVSVDWQRDVLPFIPNAPGAVTQYPGNLQRWRLNGWLDWRPDAGNTIRLGLGYAPQQIKNGLVYYQNVDANDYQEHLLIPELSWEGRWLRGLQNKFDAEYVYAPTISRSESDNVVSTNPVESELYTGLQHYRANHLVLRDHLSYELEAGGWHVVPALDLFYQHVGERTDVWQIFEGLNPPASESSYTLQSKGSLFYISPGVDVTLAKALDIQGGVIVNASSKVNASKHPVYPFVTAGLDLLKLGAASGTNSLKLFGSYAQRPTFYIDDYQLSSLTETSALQSITNYYALNGTGNPTFLPRSGPPTYWTWQTGVAYTTGDGRLTVQYSYERRNYSLTLINTSDIENYVAFACSFHHVDLRFKAVDSKPVSWVTGVTVNLMRSTGDTIGYAGNLGTGVSVIAGDLAPAGYSWTGGWVNRLALGHFSLGVDLLYHLGGSTVFPGYSRNTAALPNAYAGYRWGLPHKKGLELFVESRGLVMNTPTDVIDGRRYYTAGGSLTL